MAITTAFVRDRPAEVAFLVALLAGQGGMSSNQAKPRQAVIESRGGAVNLPAVSDVTAIALAADFHLLKCAVVLIRVTALAAAEVEPLEEKHLLRWAASRRSAF